jgi:hypothetical protein
MTEVKRFRLTREAGEALREAREKMREQIERAIAEGNSLLNPDDQFAIMGREPFSRVASPMGSAPDLEQASELLKKIKEEDRIRYGDLSVSSNGKPRRRDSGMLTDIGIYDMQGRRLKPIAKPAGEQASNP